MTTASITELKAHLSRYLREVRRGGEIQVLDRGVPIARLSPIGTGSMKESDRRARLVKAGVLRPGSADAAKVLDEKPLKLSVSVLEALVEERADRL